MSEIKRSDFPKDFLWGASTAGHQVDGNSLDQWTVWELAHASERAKHAKTRLGWQPNWNQIKDQATDPNNYVSGRAVDHYRHFIKDFGIINDLNLNTFRFSVEWSRIEPNEGVWDPAAIAHYHDYITALKDRGIEPILNIWHWTMPTWFTDKGGFVKRSNLKYFERLCRKIAQEFGREVRYMIIINEPNVYSSISYLIGEWPPSETSRLNFLRVYSNLISAHKRGYKAVKKVRAGIKIGVAQHVDCGLPARPDNLIDKLSAKASSYAWGWWFLHRVRKYQDFVGINFYRVNYMHGVKQTTPEKPLNDMGWYMEPARLKDVLVSANERFKKPIIVTENGVADAEDQHRQWWLEETIKAMYEARQAGADVVGYCHWSLLDNFEWAEGWWPKFGLVSVNRTTQERKIRKSAKWFSNWLKT